MNDWDLALRFAQDCVVTFNDSNIEYDNLQVVVYRLVEAAKKDQLPPRGHIDLKTLLHFKRIVDRWGVIERNPCPTCHGMHELLHGQAVEAVRRLAKACGIKCEVCFDRGWFHCDINRGTGDHLKIVEPCFFCHRLHDEVAALRQHLDDCGCPTYHHVRPEFLYAEGYLALARRRFLEALAMRPDVDNPVLKQIYALMQAAIGPNFPNLKIPTPSIVQEAFKEKTVNDPGLEQKLALIQAKKDLEAKLDGFRNLDIVEGSTQELTLPKGMDLDMAIHWMTKKKEEQEKELAISYRFKGYYPTDAAYALLRAIQQIYGFVSQEKTPTIFGPKPPVTIGVEADVDKIVQVPWGRMSFHGVGGYVETDVEEVDGAWVMVLAGVIRKGDADKIEALVMRMRSILAESSIYRGKAITVTYPPGRNFDFQRAPKFLDTRKTDPNSLVLSRDVEELVETNLYTPLRSIEHCRQFGIPLRRTALLEGPFGTGKSLIAAVAAKIAVAHGWTYIYLPQLQFLDRALQLAKSYAPAIIFAEDMDKLTQGDRDAEMDKYLNALDGIDRKNDEVMVVFTTNNIENIFPGFLRPGRIDAIIPVEPPDADAIERLLRLYGRGLIDPAADLSVVAERLAGHTPAICREVIDRSKLRAIGSLKAGSSEITITAAHLEKATTELLIHASYVNPQEEEVVDPLDAFGRAFGNAIGGTLVEAMARPYGERSAERLHDAAEKGGRPLLTALVDEAMKSLKSPNGDASQD